MAIFFEGSLPDGLAAAVQQSKLITCFVTDDGDESRQWEQYLTTTPLGAVLQQKAIVLRFQSGSQEASHLAALYPLPRSPTLVLMQSNGQLKDYITAGTSISDLNSRVMTVLGAAPDQTQAGSSTQEVSHQPSSTVNAQPATEQLQSQPEHQAPSQFLTQPSQQATVNTAYSSQSSFQPTPSISSEENQSGATESASASAAAAAAQRRQEKGKGRAEPEPAKVDPATLKSQDEARKASEEVRKRQKEQEKERLRILAQIEFDKAARKAKAEAERADRRAAALTAGQSAAVDGKHARISQLIRHDICSLQVRLFDGSQIRTRLPSSGTVRTEVREWVDKNIEGRHSYKFRVVYPSRVIDETEEDQTLQDLALTPSATLILIPVDKAATAYDNPNAGVLARFIGLIVHAITMVITYFTSMLPNAAAQGSGPEPPPAPQSFLRRDGASGQGTNTRRARGLPDDDAQRDYQLYNGNSLNFEPRKDDDSSSSS